MKYGELCAALVAECEPGCDYVVRITSSYYHVPIGTFGECTTYETFNVDLDDNIIWFNDWYEGQDNCYYEKPILINDLIRAYNITRQEKTGHWTIHDNHRECSKCKVWLPKDMPRNSYCPNCGIKMKSEG